MLYKIFVENTIGVSHMYRFSTSASCKCKMVYPNNLLYLTFKFTLHCVCAFTETEIDFKNAAKRKQFTYLPVSFSRPIRRNVEAVIPQQVNAHVGK